MQSSPVHVRDATRVPRNSICELEFSASYDSEDPWADVELDFEFTDPDGRTRIVPAFWDGGRTWRLRYSSAVEGVHRYRSIVRAAEVTGLDDLTGEVTVVGYSGTNSLFLHGAPQVASSGLGLTHADGNPFFWLADTWWSALTARFRWPDIFQTLVDDRAAKGFTVVLLVAGLVPEFIPFSAAMASEGGQPFLDQGKGRINPAFYSVADLKVDYLVEKGIVPCIVGGWAHYAGMIGRERVMQHWRYLVARYAAYPVVWCIAGEVNLVGIWEGLAEGRVDFGPQSAPGDAELPADEIAAWLENSKASSAEQVEIWESASALVQQIDPFGRIRTVHPVGSSSEAFTSRDSFDLDMLQTGHNGRHSIPESMVRLRESLAHGDKPVLIGECSFEGIFDSCWQDVQRFLFWSEMLSGAAGHSYGTMAISTFNAKDDQHVPLSRVSMHYWEDAISWLGAAHVAVGKSILERLEWWNLSPSPEAVEPHANPDDWFLCYAATIPDGTIIIYLPGATMTKDGAWHKFRRLTLKELRPDVVYRATYVNPRTGLDHSSFEFRSASEQHVIEASHIWNAPTGEDWVILVRPEGQATSPGAE